jgi:hypothetical protein
MQNINTLAMNATLHCLSGCAIGEIVGLILATAFGFANLTTIAISIALAFLIGYVFSLTPLLGAGMPMRKAMTLVLAADTVSIATMELADNATVVGIPGAMDATLVSPLFWGALSVSLFIAFWAAFPVNRFLLLRGKGHALVHQHHMDHN